jgi:hypothetical protein
MKSGDNDLGKRLDTIVVLLQQMLVLELASRSVPQAEIGKRVHLAKATVGKMLKGIRENGDR